MASRLADLNQASEARHITPPIGEGAPLKKEKMHPALGNPSGKYGHPISRIVGTSEKRQSVISPTNN